jgi:hypothetical protein
MTLPRGEAAVAKSRATASESKCHRSDARRHIRHSHHNATERQCARETKPQGCPHLYVVPQTTIAPSHMSLSRDSRSARAQEKKTHGRGAAPTRCREEHPAFHHPPQGLYLVSSSGNDDAWGGSGGDDESGLDHLPGCLACSSGGTTLCVHYFLTILFAW